MKIFFYIPTLALGGAERQCSLLAANLKKQFGYEVSVVIDNGSKNNKELINILELANVQIMILPANVKQSFRTLYSIFRQNRDSILFTYLTRPNVVGGIIAKLAGIRAIYSGIRTSRLPFWKWLLELSVNLFIARRTIFNSFSGAHALGRIGFLKYKILVIPNAKELSVLNKGCDTCTGDRVQILTVGRFVKDKDYPTMLAVFRKLKDMGHKFQVKIIGYGKLSYCIQEKISALELSDFVTLLPGDSDVKKELSLADIYISTSLFEGISNSIMEAMDAGLPVVATDVGDNCHLIEHGRSGYLAKVGDVEKLSEYLDTLIKDGKQRNEFGIRARKILYENYSLERMIGAYNQIIQAD